MFGFARLGRRFGKSDWSSSAVRLRGPGAARRLRPGPGGAVAIAVFEGLGFSTFFVGGVTSSQASPRRPCRHRPGDVRRHRRAGHDRRVEPGRGHRSGHQDPRPLHRRGVLHLIAALVVASRYVAARASARFPRRRPRSRSRPPEDPVDVEVLGDERLDLAIFRGRPGGSSPAGRGPPTRRRTCPPGRASRTGPRARIAAMTLAAAGSRRSARARADRRRRPREPRAPGRSRRSRPRGRRAR